MECLNEQVIHEKRQVTKPEQLIAGKTYKRVFGRGSELLKIISLETDEFDLIKVERSDSSGEKFEGTISLADCGIIPYSSGKWNPSNYLISVD